MSLYGVDVHEQYQAGIDFSVLRDQGYTFAVAKASQGWGVPTTSGLSAAAFKTRMIDWIGQIRSDGMVPGLYHWIVATSPIAQARFFYGLVVAAGGPQGMLIQLDCEDNALYADVTAWAGEWARLSGGHPLLLYTGKWWWAASGRGWTGNTITPYLWDSRYLTADDDTIADDPAVFAARIPGAWWAPGYGGWPSSTILQFTSRGDAGSLGNNVDLNVFQGTREQLLTLTQPRGNNMILIRTKSDPTIYVSDGHTYRSMNSYAPEAAYPAFQAAEKAGMQLILVDDLAQLEALAGKPANAAGTVDVPALAALLQPMLQAAAQASVEAALNKAHFSANITTV